MSRSLTALTRMLRSLRRCRRGGIAMWFALSFIPLVIVVGMAIDVTRAYVVKVHLQAALDDAGLAVASTTNSSVNLQTRLNQYFYGNFPSNQIGVPTSITMSSPAGNSNVINLTATATLQPLFMEIAGFGTLTVGGFSQVTKEPTGLELAMVLDNTGSMYTTPSGATVNNITALKTDTVDVINILFGGNTSNSQLKISLVPFVTAVNVGDLAPSIIAAGSLPTAKDSGGVSHAISYSSTDDTEWKGCVEEPDPPNDELDSAPAGSWTPYWWPTDSGTTGFHNNPWGPWSGNIDVPNNVNSNNAKTYHSPNLACGTPLTRLTSNQTTLLAAANAMQAWNRSGTMIHVGAAWGWRTISPDSVFQTGGVPDALPYNTQGWIKAMIIETDGQNDFFWNNSGNNCPNNSGTMGNCTNPDYTAYGSLSAARLGNNTSKSIATQQTEADTTLDSRLTAVCNSIKAKGIVVYAIGFSGSGSAVSSALQGCAGNGGQYFLAPDQATLQSTFETIANQLNAIRLSE